MKLRDQIDELLDRMYELLREEDTDEQELERVCDRLRKLWSAMNDDDRDLVHAAEQVLEDKWKS